MHERNRQTELAGDVINEREDGDDDDRVRLLLSLFDVLTESPPGRETGRIPLDPRIPVSVV